MKTAIEASEIVVAAYTAKLDSLKAEVKELGEHIAGLRSNSKDRPQLKDRQNRLTDSLAHAVKQLTDSLTAQSKAEEFALLEIQIAELCKLRNRLIPSQLLQAQIRGAMQNGFCQA